MKLNAIVVLLGAVVVGWVWSARQQAQGALKEQLRVADSLHTAAVVAHQQASDSARLARLQADTLRAAARREARRDAQAEQRTDSLLSASASVRDAALRSLSDSLASRDTLALRLAQLVIASSRDSAAFAAERAQHQRTVAGFVLALTQDSVALGKSAGAEKAAILRAVAAEHQAEILRKQMPSQIGQYARMGLYLAAGVGIGKIIR